MSGLVYVGCGDDGGDDGSHGLDASPAAQDAGLELDARASVDAGSEAGPTPEAGGPPSTMKPKAACQLLPAAEVAAILGVAQMATDGLSGAQCGYRSLDPDKKNVRGLLEVVTNGRAIYAANLTMYAERGMTPIPQSGIGDQAAFLSESVVLSSMMSTVGDVLLRLNLGWGEPGTSSEVQLAGERTLMLSAIERL
jgi:hypothetical protein